MRIHTAATSLGSFGGLERFQLGVSASLVARGHLLSLSYVWPDDFVDQWMDITTSSELVVSLRPSLRIRGALTGFAGAVRHARQQRPDLVYLHNAVYAGYGQLVAGRSHPVVIHLHLPPYAPRRDDLWAIRRARCIACSHELRQRWISAGLRPERVVTIHNGVDGDWFRPATSEERSISRQGLGLDPDGCVVLFAGRLDPSKGLPVLLAAWRSMLDAGTLAANSRLLVVGEPTLALGRQGGEAVVRELRAEADQATTRWLPRRRDIRPLLAAADLVVLPSTTWEGTPLIISESLASGVPVVASAVGGVPEMLTGALASMLVEPNDPVALADCMTRTLKDRPDPTALRRHVINSFNQATAFERVEDHLLETLRTR